MRLSTVLLRVVRWLLSMLFLWCLNSCGNDPSCESPIELTQVFPNNNPGGGPVLLKGKGFRPDMRLSFGSQLAEIGEQNDSFLITQVPAGLLGGVQITIGDEVCFDQIGFEVSSSFPTNLPASPTVYVVPQPGIAFALSVTTDETIPITNIADPTHNVYIRLSGSIEETIGEGPDQFSHWNPNGWYAINPPNDTVRRPSAINDQSILYLTLDRTDSNGAYISDEWVGSFQTLFDVNVNGTTVTDNFFVGFSSLNGRQYVLR